MKILSSIQIREADAYTIKNEPIASIDLMERAAKGLCNWITAKFSNNIEFSIIVGPGNNGGDGLALARMLAELDYKCIVFLIKFTDKYSEDFIENKKRLLKQGIVEIFEIKHLTDFPKLKKNGIIVDALFGSGLTRPLKGLPHEAVQYLNKTDNTIISIDIPSGLFAEENFKTNEVQLAVKANITLSFQFAKLSFFFPENEQFVGQWNIIPIGLHKDFIDAARTNFKMIEIGYIYPIIKKRSKFSHKGIFGHALLISGSYGKMGAAVLAAKACLRAGVGLLDVHIPQCGYNILQTTVPEAMVMTDKNENDISEINIGQKINAIGIGPGIGLSSNTKSAFEELIRSVKKPIIFDADALNILATEKELLEQIPAYSILTPHPGEFERLFGKSKNNFQRLELLQKMAKRYKVIIVLKGAHTTIAMPDGNCFFNTTGNPGMATAGSGDVLTGIILSLLAQGYKPQNAAIFGVYLHGFAGDIAARNLSEEALNASDIIYSLGEAFKELVSK